MATNGTTQVADACVPTSRALGHLEPRHSVTPESPSEAAHVLSEARIAGRAVVPWGNGTAQTHGANPNKYDVVCLTHGMASIVEYEPADLVLTIGAGAMIEIGRAHV